MRIVKCVLGLGALLLADGSHVSAEIALVPTPSHLESREGQWGAMEGSLIVVPPDNPALQQIGEDLATALADQAGFRLAVIDVIHLPATMPASTIELMIKRAGPSVGDEGYELEIKSHLVTLHAPSVAGLFRGATTLAQLAAAPKSKGDSPTSRPGDAVKRLLPCCVIKDQPRFRHRGMLLDCGRHFMPKELVKRYIDLLAYHKMNVLHWHLTEDQGWRIEIKKYPKLTEIGAWRKASRDTEQPRDSQGRYGGFYTQDDIREVVAYAKSRYVTVIPEIEMPGHSLAALAAYPEISCSGGPFQVGTEWGVIDDVYCAGNDKTFEFLQSVLTEVMELFPSQYIHIGGDECPKMRWKACKKCQARMKAEVLKDEHELQSYFIRRIEKFLNAKGRRIIGWDEILEGGLAPNATVQSWRGMEGAIAAAKSGHDVISSPTSHCYLDYAQVKLPGHPFLNGFLPIERVYQFDPLPPQLSAEEAKHVLGLEGNLWSERAPPSLVDRQAFPRLCAIAEIGWSPKENRNWEDFVRRMEVHNRRLDAMGVAYYKPPHSAVTPVARDSEPAWKARYEELCTRVRDGSPQLLFIGDSITHAWESKGKAVWDERYAPHHAVNLGISGDRTQHVLWRLDHGHLAGLDRPGRNPKLAVVMIGTNNSNGSDNTAEEIADGVVLVVDKLRARLPETKVLLLAIFPRNEKPDVQREKNAKASKLAADRLASDKMVQFLDIGPKFLATDGVLSKEIMPDLLHLSKKGYEIWAESIEAKLKEMMKE